MQNVTIDFETRYNKKLSLKKLTTTEYIWHDDFFVFGVGIKIEDGPTKWVPYQEIDAAFAEIDWDRTNLIAHNCRFEAAILAWHYQREPVFYSCTMSMAKAQRHYESASLAAVARRTFPNDPSMRKGDELVMAEGMDFLDETTEQAIAGYCIQDVELCHAIYERQIFDYPVAEQALIDLTIRMFADPRLALDTTILNSVLEAEINKKAQVLEDLGVSSTQLASNNQFAELLESKGVTVPMKTSPRTGKQTYAFSKTDLGFQKLMDNPVAAPFVEGRLTIKSTQNQTRAERLLRIAEFTENAELPVPLNYYGAHTGRFSGADKVNLQNFPRGGDLRKALVAPSDGWLVSVDASQIECRMLAWLAGEQDLLEQFRNKVDVYKAFASTIYNVPADQVDSTQRFVGKTAILGLGYGMGAVKFRAMLEAGATGPKVLISDDEAVSIVAKYRSQFPWITTFWNFCNNKISHMKRWDWQGESWKGVIHFKPWSIELPNGLALNYDPNEFSEETTFGGKITENIVQALSRIVLSEHMLEIDKRFPVAFTVHDEITSYVPEYGDPEDVLREMTEIFQYAPNWCGDIPLDAEGSYDHFYSK